MKKKECSWSSNLLLYMKLADDHVVFPIIILIFIDALLHWTKRNSDKDMLTGRKYDVISFEIQTTLYAYIPP